MCTFAVTELSENGVTSWVKLALQRRTFAEEELNEISMTSWVKLVWHRRTFTEESCIFGRLKGVVRFGSFFAGLSQQVGCARHVQHLRMRKLSEVSLTSWVKLVWHMYRSSKLISKISIRVAILTHWQCVLPSSIGDNISFHKLVEWN